MAAVLIVDDDEDTRAVIRMALTDEGHTCREAGDGDGAIEVLRGATSSCIVMLDEHLPGTSGGQLLRLIAADSALRARHVFVLMSADTRAATTLQNDVGLRAIIAATMLKPFDLDEMIALIHGLGDGLGDGQGDGQGVSASGGESRSASQ